MSAGLAGLVLIYWAALALVVTLLGGWLIWQALRREPFGWDTRWMAEAVRPSRVPPLPPPTRRAVTSWSYLDRAVVALWGLVLLSIGWLALDACLAIVAELSAL